MANALKPKFNEEGQSIIEQFDSGIEQLRLLIKNNDIKGQIANIKDIGAAGMKKLETLTTDPCLKRVLPELFKLDENAAKQLQSIQNPSEAGHIVCNLLYNKAQILKKCIEK